MKVVEGLMHTCNLLKDGMIVFEINSLLYTGSGSVVDRLDQWGKRKVTSLRKAQVGKEGLRSLSTMELLQDFARLGDDQLLIGKVVLREAWVKKRCLAMGWIIRRPLIW